MSDDVTRQLFDKINLISVDVSTIKTSFEFYMKLDHEPRVRALESSVNTLIQSVETLVEKLDDKKDSNKYIITTLIAIVAIVISLYPIIKH